MLRYADYDIVFQEIPDQVTLAVNLAGCPNRCPGCHSPQLQRPIGEELTEEALRGLLARYGGSATCICLMGGDGDTQAVGRLLAFVRREYPTLYTGWYSGRTALPEGFPVEVLDYLKLGPYVAALGGLKSPATNQRLYRIAADGSRTDLTHRFRSKNPLSPDEPRFVSRPDTTSRF